MVARRQTEAQLARARVEAESASRAKSEFLANMSHEIRTPLNGVMGMLQLLNAEDLDEELSEYAEIALASSRSLLTVINDILDFSKVEAGKLDLSFDAFGLDALLNALVLTFATQTRGKGITLDYRISPAVPDEVVGDMARLRQVLFNLVGNAVKFTEQGGVRIEVRAGEKPAPDRRRLQFRVTDTGIGIPEDKIGLLFEPFTQVEGFSTKRFQGTGLGLSIVKRLIKLMEGSVGIQSELGRGTTVEFDILVGLTGTDEPAPLAEPQDAVAEREAGNGSLRILVAEDEPVNAKLIERILRKWGHTVVLAGDGRQALDALLKNDIDLVLVDIQMPILSGTETVSILRKDPIYAHKAKVPVIALTAHALKGDEQKILDAGMNGYLTKPLDMTALQQEIDRTLERKGINT
jgi:CheY-like chemotaxis protein